MLAGRVFAAHNSDRQALRR